MKETLVHKLYAYKPSQAAIDLIKQTSILLLAGPTGAGKDSLKRALLETGEYHEVVSHTTRKPRLNHGTLERDDHDYHFIDEATAESMLVEQQFVEAKIYSGNIYGTSVQEIQAAHDDNRVALTDIEVQGVAEYKAIDANVMAVFLLPPSFELWQARLQRRYGDVVDIVDARRRMLTALDELEQLLQTDHYMAMINDDLEIASKEVHEIIKNRTHNEDREHEARAVAQKLTADIRLFLENTTA